MNYKRGTNSKRSIISGLIMSLMILTIGCGDNPAGDDGDDTNTEESLTMVEGELDGYNLGSQELYESEDFVDLIEGSINEDGSFSVEFLGGEAIQEALQPLAEDTDGFVAMYCRSAIIEDLSEGQQFVDVARFNFTYGEDNDVGIIGLSSEAPNINVYPPQSDNDGDYQVRWIYSNEEVTISETCEDGGSGTNEVDVEFSQGWNEVIFDLSDPDAKRMYSGERPSELQWVLET